MKANPFPRFPPTPGPWSVYEDSNGRFRAVSGGRMDSTVCETRQQALDIADKLNQKKENS